jgi:hypothetical protein
VHPNLVFFFFQPKRKNAENQVAGSQNVNMTYNQCNQKGFEKRAKISENCLLHIEPFLGRSWEYLSFQNVIKLKPLFRCSWIMVSQMATFRPIWSHCVQCRFYLTISRQPPPPRG